MTFYILFNHITTLFLSLNLLTTLSFDSEITSFMYGGNQDDLFTKVTNNSRTLALKLKEGNISSNLLVITKNRKYYFNIVHGEDRPHQFVEVRDGQINHALKEIRSFKKFDILEGQTSILVINKNKTPIVINNRKIKTKEYFSKGVPLFIGDKRILN